MTKTIAIYTFILISSIFLQFSKSYADVPPEQKPEVEHLLEFVETTDCEFERNGKKYDGERASKHIKRKYKHYRDEISSTEEFIEYSATFSTRSGKSYLVYCAENAPVESSVWLLEELAQFRDQNS